MPSQFLATLLGLWKFFYITSGGLGVCGWSVFEMKALLFKGIFSLKLNNFHGVLPFFVQI
jgi:hypothetical protein